MQTEIKFRWLLLGSFLVNVGNSFIWPLTTVYIHDQLHQSLTVSGIVL
ncbi:MFS transporter, partial [Limosilactobacillus fermentum]|nr:MFS transporter [Limosilactobacillus fermentum]